MLSEDDTEHAIRMTVVETDSDTDTDTETKDKRKVTEGWLYCMRDPSRPGWHKIGCTHSYQQTPEMRAIQLNKQTASAEKLIVELAVKCKYPTKNEAEIHNIIGTNYHRGQSHNKCEWFKVPKKNVGDLFQFKWGKRSEEKYCKKSKINKIFTTKTSGKETKKRRRPNEWKLILHDKQRLRIRIKNRKGDEWMGIYNEENHSIEYNGEEIVTKSGGSPFNKFAEYYRKSNNKNESVNAWRELECEIDGKWVSVDDEWKKQQN